MQEFVRQFLGKYQLHTDAETRYIDLVSEIGELGKEIISATDYGKMDFASNARVGGEMGDCLFPLLALCCATDVDADESLQKAMAKYERRFAQKADISSDR